MAYLGVVYEIKVSSRTSMYAAVLLLLTPATKLII